MKIQKVLNNNAVICLNEDNKEIIVTGCGIAFQKRAGDIVPSAKVEKIFTLSDNENKNKLAEMITQIPHEFIMCGEKIVALAENRGKKLDETVYVTLTDHIHGAVMRYKKGILLKCAMLWDIKRLYSDEYEISMEALKMIKEELGVEMNEDEAGFIALHLINAQLDSETGTAVKVTRIINEILSIVKYDLMLNYKEDSLAYERFITHLKAFAERIITGKMSDEKDEKIVKLVCKSYPESYKTCEKVSHAVEKTYGYKMSPDDKTYLTIHIERIRTN